MLQRLHTVHAISYLLVRENEAPGETGNIFPHSSILHKLWQRYFFSIQSLEIYTYCGPMYLNDFSKSFCLFILSMHVSFLKWPVSNFLRFKNFFGYSWKKSIWKVFVFIIFGIRLYCTIMIRACACSHLHAISRPRDLQQIRDF